MLLNWFSVDPACNLALELFLREVKGLLEDRLQSVMLYGSIVFDDLAPGYGDLDFIALLSGVLSDSGAQRLIELRKPFRSGKFGIIAHMIEGSFLPVSMLEPGTNGKAVWWGTSGERTWNENEHEGLDMRVIKEKGIVIYGENLRHMIPEASNVDCLITVKKFLNSMPRRWKPGGLHSIEWLLTCARLIYWLREGRLSSKSEAAHELGDEIRIFEQTMG